MRTRRGFVGELAAALAVGGCVHDVDRCLCNHEGEVLEELRRQISQGMIDGAVLSVSSAAHDVAVGDRRTSPERIPMTPEALFDVASITKPIVAACAALLAADGKLDPGAPFGRYLPEHALGTDSDVRVVDLATHTSGCLYRCFDGTDENRFRRELLSYRPQADRLGCFSYSCVNYLLLGMIVERVSGLRLDRFASDRLFGPLGMRHSKWGPTDDPLTVQFRHARPGEGFAEPGRIVDCIARSCAFPVGNAGLFTTAQDLMRFSRDMLSRRTFAPAYYDLQFSCAYERGAVRRSFGWDMREEGRPSGCSERTIFHTGSTGQTLVIDPANDFAIVLLTARRAGHDEAIAGRRRVCNLLRGCES